jgi:glycosyltransferase involved in cell wall biosynthesis
MIDDRVRVGLVLHSGVGGWLGGLNYFRSLLTAVRELDERKIDPVLFCAPSASDEMARMFEPTPLVRTRFLERWSPPWIARRGLAKATSRDFLLESLFVRDGIQVQSHGWPLGRRSRVASVGWIPDFQHRQLPEFFSVHERAERDREFRRLCEQSARIIVSSEDSRKALAAFSPAEVSKARVLRFVPQISDTQQGASSAEIRKAYRLPERFFHLPNQFWAHKNHEVILRALGLIRSQSRPEIPCVVATGNPNDYRQPGHFAWLEKLAADLGVRDRFLTLGVVPYKDLISLMRASIAVINPSFFEGWSTTVEEAKALGKVTVLSDISVHREQAPARGIFFDPRSPDAALAALLEADRVWSAGQEEKHVAAARQQWSRARSEFARLYERIILESL